MIYLKSNLPLYIITYGIFPLLIFLGIKQFNFKKIKLHKNVFSRDETLYIKGISAMIVIFHHYSQRMESVAYMSYFLNIGYLAVGAFLFISGYSLEMQYLLKGKGYLDGFVKRNITKLLIPFLIISIIFKFLYKVDINSFIYGISTLQFVKSDLVVLQPIWFLKAIIIFYISFYISLRFLNKNMHLTGLFIFLVLYFMICRFMGIGSWWYMTSFCFFAGAIIAKYKDLTIKFINSYYREVIVITIILFSVIFKINLIYTKVLSSIVLNFILFTLCCKIQFKSLILGFLGKISYEIFLLHIGITMYYYELNIANDGMSIIYVILVIIILAYIIHTVSRFILLNMNLIKSSK